MEPFFIGPKLLVGKKQMWEPKEKKDKNVIKVQKNPTYRTPQEEAKGIPGKKQVNQGKMTPEELAAEFASQRGTGAHNTSKKDDGKRKSNPKYNSDFNY